MAAKREAPPNPLHDPEHQKARELFRAKSDEAAARNRGAIAILEKRARGATYMVPLPGGDSVPIRARLPKTEMAECRSLFQNIAKEHEAGNTDAVERMSNQLIGHMLYVEDMDPEQIADWLAENPDKFSEFDGLEIILAFGRMLKEDAERRESVNEFRKE